MLPESAVITGSGLKSMSLKIAGLFLLERNIMVLSRAGIKKISLLLSEEEENFFNKNILKHIRNAEAEIALMSGKAPSDNSFVIPSNVFIQQHNITGYETYFKKNRKNLEPIYSDDLFIVNDESDCRKAEKKISEYIIKNTGGYIAQKINKRISIPISLKLTPTRIHPNYLTVFNMIIGLLSSFFIFMAASGSYSPGAIYAFMVLGGFLFQAASVLDGVDGEVAKFTLKVSKIGGWLDTFSDNTTLILFLVSNSWLFYTRMGGMVSLLTIAVLFTGLAIMLGSIVSYLRKYSESGSLVAYDKEFLQKLPESDRLVTFALKMKYITKKEMFSIFFFLFAFTGHIYYIIPMAAFVLLAAAIILVIINRRYMNDFAEGKNS
ncbi:MAG TPA: CDP-alcohol phosphatidyltransferase family protein [Spirochaetota bacterium]|nr:CDP-alcohol phosphatidyltransferase family protein [Spirochaetota bacterium]HPF05944.1 CDP-alcohol phosphatidyltransferase family protein [Spirochaetota bacterium]HRX46422.1 CDP-alcohol phosphatidyltransferase family protein [Spirochaetota bacterium]